MVDARLLHISQESSDARASVNSLNASWKPCTVDSFLSLYLHGKIRQTPAARRVGLEAALAGESSSGPSDEVCLLTPKTYTELTWDNFTN